MLRDVLTGLLNALRERLRGDTPQNASERDSRTALMDSVIDRETELARTLLDAGADVDAQDAYGWTALHFAAQNSDLAMTQLLLEHGATPDIEDEHGNTALGRAVYDSAGRGEVIRALLAAGADKHHRNKHGRSPLDLARMIANYDVAGFLE